MAAVPAQAGCGTPAAPSATSRGRQGWHGGWRASVKANPLKRRGCSARQYQGWRVTPREADSGPERRARRTPSLSQPAGRYQPATAGAAPGGRSPSRDGGEARHVPEALPGLWPARRGAACPSRHLVRAAGGRGPSAAARGWPAARAGGSQAFCFPWRCLLPRSPSLPSRLASRPLLLSPLPPPRPAPPALRSRRRDLERSQPRPFPRCSSLSPQSRMSSIQNLQSFGKTRRRPTTPLGRSEPCSRPPRQTRRGAAANPLIPASAPRLPVPPGPACPRFPGGPGAVCASVPPPAVTLDLRGCCRPCTLPRRL